MSRLSVTRRIGTLVATGAITLGLATATAASAHTSQLAKASVTSAQTTHATFASAGCPKASKIKAVVHVKLKTGTARSDGVTQCQYANAGSHLLVDVAPKAYAHMATTTFEGSLKKTAGSHRLSKLSVHGAPAGYFVNGQHFYSRKVRVGYIDAAKHVIIVWDNHSAKQLVSLMKAVG